MHTNIQHQLNTSTAVSNTAFTVENGLIELTEDTKVEGYNKNCNAYTFAGAPAEITTFNGVTRLIQAQFDHINNNVDTMNAELDSCIKSCINTLMSDVTLSGGHMFCGVTFAEIGHLSGVASNVQTRYNNTIK